MTIADTLPSNGNIFDGIKVLKQKQKILIQLPNQLYHGLKYPLFVLCKKVEIQTKKKNTGKKVLLTLTELKIIVMIKYSAVEYMFFIHISNTTCILIQASKVKVLPSW